VKVRKKIRIVAACVLIAISFYFFWSNQREHRYDKVIRSAAERYGVDPALVKAVAWRETKFNSTARGRAQEIGLMQIRESAALDWASAEKVFPFEHEQILDPVTNTLAGAWYLKKLLKRYAQTDNAIPYALADYNAGRGNVLKWMTNSAVTNSEAFMQQIGFPGTSNYVRAVMKRSAKYQMNF
jgi:soluble lytic murein transglycosylase